MTPGLKYACMRAMEHKGLARRMNKSVIDALFALQMLWPGNYVSIEEMAERMRIFAWHHFFRSPVQGEDWFMRKPRIVECGGKGGRRIEFTLEVKHWIQHSRLHWEQKKKSRTFFVVVPKGAKWKKSAKVLRA